VIADQRAEIHAQAMRDALAGVVRVLSVLPDDLPKAIASSRDSCLRRVPESRALAPLIAK
jgi:hypothetical protein